MRMPLAAAEDLAQFSLPIGNGPAKGPFSYPNAARIIPTKASRPSGEDALAFATPTGTRGRRGARPSDRRRIGASDGIGAIENRGSAKAKTAIEARTASFFPSPWVWTTLYISPHNRFGAGQFRD
jgi:hypothetical protein